MTDIASAPSAPSLITARTSFGSVQAAGTLGVIPTGAVVYISGPGTSVASPSLPAWVPRYADRLNELLSAGVGEAGWNGHRARPLRPEAIRLGVRVLAALLDEEAARPFPWIVPTIRGGLQFEWHQDNVDLEIDIDPNGSVDVVFSDAAEQKDWDGTLTEREADVRRILDRLADTLGQ